MRSSRLHFLALLLGAALALLPATVAASTGTIRSAHVAADLVLENPVFAPGQSRQVLLRLVMDPAWHTYWKNPGDSGQATALHWELPAGFRAGDIRWPTPQKISAPPLMSYGYENEVLLLSSVSAPASARPGDEFKARVEARWLECADICLPGKAQWELTLKVAAADSAQVVASRTAETAALFARAYAALPAKAKLARTDAWRERDSLLLSVGQFAARPFDTFYFFEASGGLLQHAAPQNTIDGTGGEALALALDPNAAQPGDRLRGVLIQESWFGPDQAYEIDWPLRTAPPAAGEGTTSPGSLPTSIAASTGANTAVVGGEQIGLWTAILFSFLGGMILNLMPCVFPVLSLKVFSLINHAGDGLRSRMLSAGAYTGGILISFWLLAATLLILRGGGQALGWGFQLQSPVFVFFLCVGLFLFALNLLGVFEINIALSGGGTTDGVERQSYSSSFFSGILAVIVATPCTAPFMGAALGFALTQSIFVALAVFSALGLGLAAPFLFLTMFPGIARLLPRPGAWMLTLKQFMGFLMLATVLWLVWVYGRLTDTDGVALLLMAFLLVGIGAWILGRWNLPSRSSVTRWSARAGALVLLIAAALGGTLRESIAAGTTGAGAGARGTVATSETQPASFGDLDATVREFQKSRAAQPGEARWLDFSPALIAGLRSSGVPVLIDFTADWCLSCKVNERVALSSDRIWKSFYEKGLVTVKADWTNEDETITKALAGYGRSGVPLYVLYDREGRVSFLPAVLTERIVLDAVAGLASANKTEIK